VSDSIALQDLLSAEAVRQRCSLIGTAAAENRTRWFAYRPEELEQCIDLVAEECLQNYPDLNIPYHSRWRHFVTGGLDLWHYYADKNLAGLDNETRTRCAIDLVFISVLLDAGAGGNWQYIDPVSHNSLSRSEGLAAATVDLFFNHLGRVEDGQGVVIDAAAILGANRMLIENAFQHRRGNSLLGMEGRIRLLTGLANQLKQLTNLGISRPGHLYDFLLERSENGQISAAKVLQGVLQLFNPIWPRGMTRDGVHLGDCGHHRLLPADSFLGLVPFHKLSQWLTYSLIEPLGWAGLEVTNLDQLTGLPEYRNGGLLIDTGVLAPVPSELLIRKLTIESEAVVEWRALTVWLLDKVALGVRQRLNRTAKQLPLASVLQGGTWSAGRKLANSLRDGAPPLNLDIDGTVF